ncbi:hypothetical protein D3C72_2058970 [compost metagenome]
MGPGIDEGLVVEREFLVHEGAAQKGRERVARRRELNRRHEGPALGLGRPMASPQPERSQVGQDLRAIHRPSYVIPLVGGTQSPTVGSGCRLPGGKQASEGSASGCARLADIVSP